MPLPTAPGDEAAMLPKTPLLKAAGDAPAPAGDAAGMRLPGACIEPCICLWFMEVCTAMEPQPCETVLTAGVDAGKNVSGVWVKNLKGPFMMAFTEAVGPVLNWTLQGACGAPGINLGAAKAMMTTLWRQCNL